LPCEPAMLGESEGGLAESGRDYTEFRAGVGRLA